MSAPDLSRLRGMAALPSTILLRVSQEELRYLLAAHDERDRLVAEVSALREAAGDLLAILEAPSGLSCEWNLDPAPCLGLATRRIQYSKYVGWNVCDKHAVELRPEPNDRPLLADEELPHAAPLRVLRTLLGRTP